MCSSTFFEKKVLKHIVKRKIEEKNKMLTVYTRITKDYVVNSILIRSVVSFQNQLSYKYIHVQATKSPFMYIIYGPTSFH